MNLLAVLVEFVGTFIFLSVIVLTGSPLAIGATLTTLIYFAINMSGGHFNPAVTIMTLYNKGMAVDTASGYIVAQIIGGIGAITLNTYMKQKGILK